VICAAASFAWMIIAVCAIALEMNSPAETIRAATREARSLAGAHYTRSSVLLSATLKGSELDPAATRRELREYLALSDEANHKLAQRIGITVVTCKNFLSGKRAPQAKTLGKIRAFLRAEARRTSSRD
jgi:transcriptional regulator with XRE-family HTH domain